MTFHTACLLGVDELEEFIQKEIESLVGDNVEPWEILDNYFEGASPYYDADRELCFYGLRIPNNHEINEQWFAKVQKIADSFEELTGVKPRIRGGAHVW